MKKNKCEKCGALLYIDEWNGWIWTCTICGDEGGCATDEEIKKQESELYSKK